MIEQLCQIWSDSNSKCDNALECYDEIIEKFNMLGFEIIFNDNETVSYFEDGVEIYQSKYGAVNPNEYTIL